MLTLPIEFGPPVLLVRVPTAQNLGKLVVNDRDTGRLKQDGHSWEIPLEERDRQLFEAMLTDYLTMSPSPFMHTRPESDRQVRRLTGLDTTMVNLLNHKNPHLEPVNQELTTTVGRTARSCLS